jgi:hypothetical protein
MESAFNKCNASMTSGNPGYEQVQAELFHSVMGSEEDDHFAVRGQRKRLSERKGTARGMREREREG